MRFLCWCVLASLLVGCDIGQLAVHELSGEWSLRYGEFEVSQDGTEVLTVVEDLPETSCEEWGVWFVEMSLQGPDQSAETHELVMPCEEGGHAYRFDGLTAGEYVLRTEASVADGTIYFFNEEVVTVEPWGEEHDALLVPLVGAATLSYTADDSSGTCEAEGVDSVVVTFTPQLGEQGTYPTEADFAQLWGAGKLHQVSNMGALMDAMGLSSECFIEQLQAAFGTMSPDGWSDPTQRARAVQGFDWKATVVGLAGELETHTSESGERRIPVGATPPADFGLICLDTTGLCD